MYVYKLELNQFRNYEELSLSFDRNVNLFLGNNAQGKTNLLEAIYLAGMGRSFRTSHDHELIRFGSDFAKVKVYAHRDYLDTQVEIQIKARGKSAADKFIKKDGKPLSKTSQLLSNIMIVIFSPEDLKIVKDEPEKRRRFIDRELCQISPQYYNCYTNYKKSLLQRNTYLKEERIDPEIMDIWDVQLSRYGAVMILMRDAFIKDLSRYSSSIHAGITGGSEFLKLVYEPSVKVCAEAEEQEEAFYSALKKSYESDVRTRNTGVGPHRDDVSFYVNDIDMRAFGSQGQQRTCALSLKLAELNLIKEETGEDAILLLDDVMSELDASRQEFLIDTMKKNQLFITTTDIDPKILNRFQDAAVFHVKEGKISKEKV